MGRRTLALDPTWGKAAEAVAELHRALGVEESAARCTMIRWGKGWRVTVIRLSDGMTMTRRVA